MDADFIIQKYQRTSKRKSPAVRSYFCYRCGSWHITSQNQHYIEEIVQLKQRIATMEDASKKEDQILILADARVKKLNETLAKKA